MDTLKIIAKNIKSALNKHLVRPHFYWRTRKSIYPKLKYEGLPGDSKYKTIAMHILFAFYNIPAVLWYYAFWLFLKIFWDPLTLNLSKWFTWEHDFDLNGYDFEGKMSEIPARFDAPERREGISDLLVTNILWQRVATFHPAACENVTDYVVGIIREYDGQIILSKLIVHGEIGLLQGPKVVKVFAFRLADMTPIKIERRSQDRLKWELELEYIPIL